MGGAVRVLARGSRRAMKDSSVLPLIISALIVLIAAAAGGYLYGNARREWVSDCVGAGHKRFECEERYDLSHRTPEVVLVPVSR